jgi:ABC-type Na+ efflux pump permease subunit
MDKLQDVIDVKMMKRTIRWAAVVTLLGAIVMYKLEGATIVENGVESPNPVGSILLAVWWSFTTVATGGFGDIHNPISINGQILTAILVITGMVLIGVFTATLTSLFVGEQSEEIERLQDDLSMKIDAIAERLDKLDPD